MASGDNTRATGASLVDDLRALTGGNGQARKQLKTLDPVGVLAEKRGRADYVAPDTSTSTGGIASPLIEESFGSRTYYDEVTLKSSDGLFTLKLKPIKQVTSRDANGDAVVQIYAQPPVEDAP